MGSKELLVVFPFVFFFLLYQELSLHKIFSTLSHTQILCNGLFLRQYRMSSLVDKRPSHSKENKDLVFLTRNKNLQILELEDTLKVIWSSLNIL